VREDITVDEFIDVVLGNRKYIKCLYVYNKIDSITLEELDKLAHELNTIVIRFVIIFLQLLFILIFK
jgi:ribosome-interacting GTPase 1